MSKTIKDLANQFQPTSITTGKLIKLHVEPAETIADQQIIEIGKLLGTGGVLPLEHIKALEILVKIKKLHKNHPINADSNPEEPQVSTEELLNIAGKIEHEPTDESPSGEDPLG